MRSTMTTAVLMATLGLVACTKSSSGDSSAGPTASASATAAPATAAPADHRRICKNPPATGGNSMACYTCVERECSTTFNGMMNVCSA